MKDLIGKSADTETKRLRQTMSIGSSMEQIMNSKNGTRQLILLQHICEYEYLNADVVECVIFLITN